MPDEIMTIGEMHVYHLITHHKKRPREKYQHKEATLGYTCGNYGPEFSNVYYLQSADYLNLLTTISAK